NKAKKLLKILRGCPESDRTKPNPVTRRKGKARKGEMGKSPFSLFALYPFPPLGVRGNARSGKRWRRGWSRWWARSGASKPRNRGWAAKGGQVSSRTPWQGSR